MADIKSLQNVKFDADGNINVCIGNYIIKISVEKAVQQAVKSSDNSNFINPNFPDIKPIIHHPVGACEAKMLGGSIGDIISGIIGIIGKLV
jgi:hypothetical protein